MNKNKNDFSNLHARSCCPSSDQTSKGTGEVTRRDFIKTMGGSTLSFVALSGISWPVLAGLIRQEHSGIRRQALIVKPLLVYSIPEYEFQNSWRSWGGIQTQ